ncbi:hypothetical protein W97_00719 [Coniosporium apollinis CBS 100218]|uniref:Major facilitator superfamily (MFS) profile domain-containing protein n=1 Tax=Coniosporium apollinis (strain CBS 100218) TaxID=1168221 RepID=R7YI64_CONA1|nr:uncharacterized protein W97_00719 [Coniosporium apollinis CBS 100218]EON61504.1 hypothetical protein W97_00719 [Coniosporium apollinis CBS 100218]
MAYHTTTAESGDEIAAVFQAAPGTEILYDTGTEHGATSQHLHTLQHARKGDSHILLVPQPSLTNPNDPLCWPELKKWVTLANGVWYSFNGAVTGPIMAAGMIPLSEHFGQSLQKLTYSNGATLICQGVATTVWMPFAVKYGRRPVYLLSNLLMGVACIWLGVASTKTYTPFLIGRAFLGIFEAPIESIVPSTITDVFFLHDRGEKVSIYGLSVLGGNEIGPMLSAFIIQSLGMNWAFYIVAMVIATNLLTMFFFMPETKFTGARPPILPASSEQNLEKAGSTKHIESLEISKAAGVTDDPQEMVRQGSYVQSLAFWGRNDPEVSLIKTFLRPFVLLAYPTVLWSCVIYGLALGWNVILGSTIAQLFAPPPYLFSESAQGLIFLSPFVGSLVGTYLCGPFADFVADWYTKRNHGIREPEMRLPTCFIAAALTFLGALMSGLSYHYKTHWSAPVVGFGVLSTGGQMGATLAMSYALDCHKELSVELMVTIASLKSVIAWIWTWVINDWVIKDGALTVFMVVATVNVVAYMSTFYFYYRGKAIRVWLHQADFLGRAGVR